MQPRENTRDRQMNSRVREKGREKEREKQLSGQGQQMYTETEKEGSSVFSGGHTTSAPVSTFPLSTICSISAGSGSADDHYGADPPHAAAAESKQEHSQTG